MTSVVCNPARTFAGVKCNMLGTAADDHYVEVSGNESQFYKFYRMHNMHFTVWMAMHEGRFEDALSYARKMQTYVCGCHWTYMGEDFAKS